jgi:hypothetical protein
MNYSKMTTQFETQATAFGRLRTALPYPEYIVRGYDGYIKVYQSTEDHKHPKTLLTLFVKASLTADEVGFFKKSPTEATIVGRDIAFRSPEFVKEMLGV